MSASEALSDRIREGLPSRFDLALEAAQLGIELKLPLADSVILATARLHEPTVWTHDEHFDGMEGARYIPKKNRTRPLRYSLLAQALSKPGPPSLNARHWNTQCKLHAFCSN